MNSDPSRPNWSGLTKFHNFGQISQFQSNFTILEYLDYLELGQFRIFCDVSTICHSYVLDQIHISISCGWLSTPSSTFLQFISIFVACCSSITNNLYLWRTIYISICIFLFVSELDTYFYSLWYGFLMVGCPPGPTSWMDRPPPKDTNFPSW